MESKKSSPLPSIIIHGHFYQPPREDPWSYEILQQPSAYPFHDWNDRIAHECYIPNTESRILDKEGRILHIINNYVSMSFNFGPTLLNWLEEKYPESYEAIIHADKLSMESNQGHGNAMAQVYNHPIMPLCNTRDMDTQIIWGIEDFISRFNREPEGIWLSETAINYQVALRLMEFGIKFVILSPDQAYKVYHPQTHKATDVSRGDIDTSKAYYIPSSKGSKRLGVFFYNKGISQAISFKHLLHDAGRFRQALLGQVRSKENPGLVLAATDGESYGHHEAFGDMCFAAMVYENKEQPAFQLTNPGAFLEQNPATWEVELKPGKGTSWSCYHGVGRWMENCGCSTGGKEGWNQRWREPLRNAFDDLRDHFVPIFERETKPYLKDPWAARNDYIQILRKPGSESLNAFLKKHAKTELSQEDREDVLMLLESQKFAMYMYTSCAWFFADISGIETIQNLRYAQRSMELVQPFFTAEEESIPAEFVGILRKAKSNIDDFQNGEWIYQHEVVNKQWCLEKILYYFLLSKIVKEVRSPSDETIDLENRTLFSYQFSNLAIKKKQMDQVSYYYGTVLGYNPHLDQRSTYAYYIVNSQSKPLVVYLKRQLEPRTVDEMEVLINQTNPERNERVLIDWCRYRYTLGDIPQEYLQQLFTLLFQRDWERLYFGDCSKRETLNSLYETGKTLLYWYHLCGVKFSREQRLVLADLFIRILYDLEKKHTLSWDPKGIELLETFVTAIQSDELPVELKYLADVFSLELQTQLECLQECAPLPANQVTQILRLLDFANRCQLNFNRRKAETLVFRFLYAFDKNPLDHGFEETDYQALYSIGEKLNIRVPQFREPKTDS